jgi:peptidyl-dipeptidase A
MTIVAAFLQHGIGYTQERRYVEGSNMNLGEALQFLREYDREASGMCFRVTSSQWNYSTNITEKNKRHMFVEQALSAKFHRSSWRRATSYTWTRLPDPVVRRQFHMLAIEGRAALPEEKFTELQQLITEMKDIYSRARICPHSFSSTNYNYRHSGSCDLALDPDLTRIMSHSRDYDEQLHVWRAWRDAVGPPIRSKYIRYVQLANHAARLNGFHDAGQQQRESYEDSDFNSQLTDLWTTLAPLYRQLHAYVRRRLVELYGSERVRPDGPLPAHLLGNMWAQNWRNLADLVMPFPAKPPVDVSSEMLRQGYTPLRMFHLAEEFFTSLGLKPMPPEFWHHSMLEKPLDREVACRASAWDFCNHIDYRIKQCTTVSMEDLLTIHHEMAHIQYYLQYADQPLLFRDGANPGFHEAVGDVITLSVSNPRHLQGIGLLHNATDDYETGMNFLLMMALEKVAYLPFAYIVDQWRWGLFAGDWNIDEMNARWWELRLRHQGIIPPIPRTENDFDPASKYHIPADMPYTRYFVSLVLQFQLHEVLCEAAGHFGPLHTCNIYRSREAGRLLGDILSLGSSRPWPEVIRIMTRGRTDKLDARPLLEYFKPLSMWLNLQNRDESLVGWSTTGEDTALFARWSQDGGYAVAPSIMITILAIVFSLA